MIRSSRPVAVALGALTAIVVAGTTSFVVTAAEPASAGTSAPGTYDTPLADVCPETVIVQSNWWPQADSGYLYQLIGPDGDIDADNYVYSGPLGSTGVDLEIRAGGPARGGQQVSSLLYQDDAILLGQAGTDEAIQNSASNPVRGVFAFYQRNPQILLWGNPEWDFQSVAEVGDADVIVYANSAAIWLRAYLAEGLLREEQIDGNYEGGPARFVAEDGHIVQQGLVTNEPYVLEHLTPAWGRPVNYFIAGDSYPIYTQSLSIRPDRLEEERDCLERLIPLFQRAAVDYLADPTAVNELLVEYREQIAPGVYDLGLAEYTVDTFTRESLVRNGLDGVVGSFDSDRVQGLIDRLVPVYATLDKPPLEDLTPDFLVTNEFLDSSVSFPA